jgi:hypothetical protein
MTKIEVEGDKAKIELYEGHGNSSHSRVELTRDQMVNNAIEQMKGIDDLHTRDQKMVNGILDTYLETLDKMNEENNGE